MINFYEKNYGFVVVGGFRLIVDSDLDREYTEGNPDVLNISTTLFKKG